MAKDKKSEGKKAKLAEKKQKAEKKAVKKEKTKTLKDLAAFVALSGLCIFEVHLTAGEGGSPTTDAGLIQHQNEQGAKVKDPAD